MYTYARAKSVLRKAQDAGIKNQELRIKNFKEEEIELLRSFYRFEVVVWQAARDLSPNVICTYLYELAQKFNLFYQKHKIIGETPEIQRFRLNLSSATSVILKQGLYLLGIETVERM